MLVAGAYKLLLLVTVFYLIHRFLTVDEVFVPTDNGLESKVSTCLVVCNGVAVYIYYMLL